MVAISKRDGSKAKRATTAVTAAEQALLDTLAQSPLGRATATTFGGRKPYTGGKVSGGVREYEAAKRLIDKGLVQFIKSDRYQISGHGYTTHCYELTFGKIDTTEGSIPCK